MQVEVDQVQVDQNTRVKMSALSSMKFAPETIDAMMKKYDTNGDGVFDRAEVSVIVRELTAARYRSTFFRRLVVGLVLLLLISIVANFSTSLAAFQLLKDLMVGADNVMKSSSSGDAAMTGEPNFGATVISSSARRLEWRHGRAMVQVASMSNGVCSNAVAIHKATHRIFGSIDAATAKSTSTDVMSGHIVAKATNADGTLEYTVKDPTGMACSAANAATYGGCKVTMQDKSAAGSDCPITASPVVRLRELQISSKDADFLRRGRALAIANGTRAALGVDEYHSTHPNDPFEHPCVAYHCFEGDAGCVEPAPDELCLAWEGIAGETRKCVEPLCRYMLSNEVYEPSYNVLGLQARRLASIPAGLADALQMHFRHPSLVKAEL